MGAPFARTIDNLVEEWAVRDPKRLAAMTPHGQATFGELHQRATSIAAALHRDGAGRGDAVGLLAPNSTDWLAVAVGAMRAGCSVAALNTWARQWDLEQLLPYVRSRLHSVFTVGEFKGFDFARAWLDLLAHDGAGASGRPSRVAPRVVQLPPGPEVEGVSHLEAWIGGERDDFKLPPGEGSSPTDAAFILFTSGSTAAPKAVPLAHFACIENGFNIGERQGVRSLDRVWTPVPFFWSYGCANALMAAWTHGASVVFDEAFEPGPSLALIEGSQATLAYTLPNITQALLGHPHFSTSRTSSLRGGLAIGSPEDIAAVAKELRAPEICNVYGLTEVYGNSCVTPHTWDLDRRLHSQGPPLPGVAIRIIDPGTSEPVPAGQEGEITVSGYVTPGYLPSTEDAARLSLTPEGFLRTGDAGFLDDGGDIHYIGRFSEMIKTGGINVSPLEVEEFISRHPDIRTVGVVGIPDPRRGEAVVAFVVKDADSPVTEHELREFCRQSMAAFKVPTRVHFLEHLPTTPTSKLARKELRALAVNLGASTSMIQQDLDVGRTA